MQHVFMWAEHLLSCGILTTLTGFYRQAGLPELLWMKLTAAAHGAMISGKRGLVWHF